MKFDFKSTDMVRCRVLRTTKIGGETANKDAEVSVIGNLAKSLMSGPNPALERMSDYKPEPMVERDREVIITNPDPDFEAPKKRVAPKKKTAPTS